MKDCRNFCGGFFHCKISSNTVAKTCRRTKLAFVLRDAEGVVPYGCKTTCRKANITAVGDTTYRQVNITLRSKILLLFFTSLVLTSISFRQATLPIGESKESEIFQRYID